MYPKLRTIRAKPTDGDSAPYCVSRFATLRIRWCEATAVISQAYFVNPLDSEALRAKHLMYPKLRTIRAKPTDASVLCLGAWLQDKVARRTSDTE